MLQLHEKYYWYKRDIRDQQVGICFYLHVIWNRDIIGFTKKYYPCLCFVRHIFPKSPYRKGLTTELNTIITWRKYSLLACVLKISESTNCIRLRVLYGSQQKMYATIRRKLILIARLLKSVIRVLYRLIPVNFCTKTRLTPTHCRRHKFDSYAVVAQSIRCGRRGSSFTIERSYKIIAYDYFRVCCELDARSFCHHCFDSFHSCMIWSSTNSRIRSAIV